MIDGDGKVLRPGNILYAAMTLGGTKTALYRYADDGFVDYFDSAGRSARKALLRTPIDGARLSSSFGMRKHPVMGYSRMHKGIDFAAGKGTPIYAAGDGIVERASRFGNFGNYIRLRHNSDYATAYGHLSRYAKGIHPGKRVKQGQVIGYVGSTGRSTGPHLHYEVLYNGKQVNPLSVKLPTGTKLAGKALAGFKAESERRYAQFVGAPTHGTVVARADGQ